MEEGAVLLLLDVVAVAALDLLPAPIPAPVVAVGLVEAVGRS